MVRPFDLEPSTIRAFSVDGSPLDIERAWMVHPFDLEPSTIRAYSVDGSPLDIEPSMISTSSVEGSVDLYRTIRDMALQHGRFAAHPALGQCQEPE